MEVDRSEYLNFIAQTIYNKKGTNILGLDVRGISSLTDYLIIAEGNVDRHVIAIAKELIHTLDEKYGEKPIHAEGLEHGDWVVLDYVDVIIHLFMPGLREKYNLDKLWSDGKIISLNIVVDPEKISK